MRGSMTSADTSDQEVGGRRQHAEDQIITLREEVSVGMRGMQFSQNLLVDGGRVAGTNFWRVGHGEGSICTA